VQRSAREPELERICCWISKPSAWSGQAVLGGGVPSKPRRAVEQSLGRAGPQRFVGVRTVFSSSQKAGPGPSTRFASETGGRGRPGIVGTAQGGRRRVRLYGRETWSAWCVAEPRRSIRAAENRRPPAARSRASRAELDPGQLDPVGVVAQVASGALRQSPAHRPGPASNPTTRAGLRTTPVAEAAWSAGSYLGTLDALVWHGARLSSCLRRLAHAVRACLEDYEPPSGQCEGGLCVDWNESRRISRATPRFSEGPAGQRSRN